MWHFVRQTKRNSGGERAKGWESTHTHTYICIFVEDEEGNKLATRDIIPYVADLLNNNLMLSIYNVPCHLSEMRYR